MLLISRLRLNLREVCYRLTCVGLQFRLADYKECSMWGSHSSFVYKLSLFNINFFLYNATIMTNKGFQKNKIEP